MYVMFEYAMFKMYVMFVMYVLHSGSLIIFEKYLSTTEGEHAVPFREMD